MEIFKTTITSLIGRIELQSSNEGLLSVQFVSPDDTVESVTPTHPILTETARQLLAYFSDERTAFDVPLAPEGTVFQQEVWHLLKQIPFGKTVSYKTIADQLGDRKKVRAVGMANGKNPIAIIIPCHRVIGADGSLTGYAGGLHRKEWLLQHEGVLNLLQFT